MTRRAVRLMATWAAGALLAAACTGGGSGKDAASAGRPVRFGFYGDTPYSTREAQAVSPLIEQMNDADLDLAISVGDIFGSVCEDNLYAATVERFNSSVGPMVYVPGDNEWADCHETPGTHQDGSERLAFIRRTMFADDMSFGRRKIRLEQQRPAYPENGRWRVGPFLFVSVNVAGSNNNHVADPDEPVEGSFRGAAERRAAEAEYLARDEANRAWLHQSFEIATRDGAPAMVIAIHADPGFETPPAQRATQQVDGFDRFLAALVVETKAFARPVVLIHGDSHRFVHDRPLIDPGTGQPVPNFIRVETFGSPDVGWVEVTLDPRQANDPQVAPRLVRGR